MKESDRIGAMQQELAQLGVGVETTADGLAIRGGQPRPAMFKSHGDHRIAMAAAVAANAIDGRVARSAAGRRSSSSYPEFADDLGTVARR